MGCSGCGSKNAAAHKATYKYLTRSQIETRFNKFKKENCAKFCKKTKECTVFDYRVCKIKKGNFGLL